MKKLKMNYQLVWSPKIGSWLRDNFESMEELEIYKMSVKPIHRFLRGEDVSDSCCT